MQGVFRSVSQLVNAIEEYVAHHNETLRDYQWHKSAEELLTKVNRAKAALGKCHSD